MKFKHLPEEMQHAIRALQELYGTPEEFAITFMLGIVNSAVAPYYNVNSSKYGVRPTALYLMALADTGIGKGTIERELTQWGQRTWLEQEKAKNLEASKDHRMQTAIYDKKYKNWEKQVVAGDIDPINDPAPEAPLPLRQYNYRVEKGTLNGFIELFTARPYLLLQGSEGGEFFNSHSFRDAGDGGTEIMTAFTKLWEGDTLDKNTGIESKSIPNRRMCVNVMMQKDTVLDIMRNKVFRTQGILNRFLFVETGRQKRKEWIPDKDDEDNEIRVALVKPFHDRVYEMFRDLPVREGAQAIELQELPTIESTIEARNLMIDQLANRWSYEGHPNFKEDVLVEYAGFRERIHEHGIRIAATIACFNKHDKIKLKDAKCAVELMEFFIEQRDLFETPGVSRNPHILDNAEKLWRWIEGKQWQGTKSNLYKSVRWFYALGEQDRNDILTELCASGRMEFDGENKRFTLVKE